MKKIPTLAIIMALQLVASAEPTSERNQRDRDQLYDSMTARLFAEYVNIQNFHLPNKEKQEWMHLGANAAFQYWITTRKGGVRQSKKVDSAIAFFYENALESKITAGFSDPLYRMNLEEADNIGVSGFPKITHAQYKQYVEEFKVFLNGVLMERRSRQDEMKKKREILEQEAEQAGADQPATKFADKVPAKVQPSTPTSKDGPR
jgi:hypothetical protein